MASAGWNIGQTRALAAALFAVALLVVGCSGGDADDTGAPTTTGSAQTTATTGSTDGGTTPTTSSASRIIDATAATTSTTAVAIDDTPRPTTTTTPEIAAGEWHDHTLPELDSLDEFRAMAAVGAGGQELVKFTITDFLGTPEVSFMDLTFYEFHDEISWFRLLNGQAMPSTGFEPTQGLRFDTIDEVYDWAEQFIDRAAGRDTMPYDLAETRDGRIVSPRFYHQNHGPPGARSTANRTIGAGNVIRFPAVDGVRDEVWALSLEYADGAPPAQIDVFMTTVTEALPPEIGDRLVWAVRSPVHEAVAQQMEAEELPWHDRIVRYSELAIDGETEVYSAAVAVGRLRIVDDPAMLNSALDTDVLIVEDFPDFLPPAAAILTATPQTPLAHVSILAQNRGIPSAYVGGILDDPDIRQLSGPRARVAVLATADGTVEIVPLTDELYDEWVDATTRPTVSVEQVDVAALPMTVDLEQVIADGPLSERGLANWRRTIGGKAAGMLSLIDDPAIETPSPAGAITIAAYAEHMARPEIRRGVDAVLNAPDFDDELRVRHLLLEGLDDHLARFATDADAALAEQILATASPTVREVVDAGGLRRWLRTIPILPNTLAEISTDLEALTADLSLDQGLRFRSSSTVEDLDGFNGAGLYDSNTGFLDPSRDERGRTIEDAILRTWASYWGSEAYEERELFGVEHRSGAMAILVHPRFDDEHEIANGVVTIEITPASPLDDETKPRQGSISFPRSTATINVQPGPLSVVTPDRDVQPERLIVERRDDAGEATATRYSWSSEGAVPALTDEQVFELFDLVDGHARRWLERANTERQAYRSSPTVTLDLEFKLMTAAWPARSDGSVSGDADRIVIKQVRPLDPPRPELPVEVERIALPDDIVRRLAQVDQVTCNAEGALISWSVAFTDPSIPPDLNMSETGWFAEGRIAVGGETLLLNPDIRIAVTRDEFVFTAGGVYQAVVSDLQTDAPRMLLSSPDGTVDIDAPASCNVVTLWSSNTAALLDEILGR